MNQISTIHSYRGAIKDGIQLKKERWQRILLYSMIGVLVILFGYTGVAKLLDYDNFKASLSESPFISFLSPVLSWGLPVFEILLAMLLLVPRTRSLALWVSFALMSIFSLYIGFMLLIAPDDMPCSCGGVLEEMSWEAHLVFNLLITAGAFAAVRMQALMTKHM